MRASLQRLRAPAVDRQVHAIDVPRRGRAQERDDRAQFGRIVNVISTSVKEPIAGLGVSNTIRGAVASWAKTLATELGGDGITVNNVLPGYTRTQRLDQILHDRAQATGQQEDAIAKGMLATVPAGRFADAGELGGVIAFLCSPAAGYVNGVNLPVDGGRTKSL